MGVEFADFDQGDATLGGSGSKVNIPAILTMAALIMKALG
jgi:hypothetical protein